MYDRLGDLLNETLESGGIKFVHIDKDGNISEKKVNLDDDASSKSKQENNEAKDKTKTESPKEKVNSEQKKNKSAEGSKTQETSSKHRRVIYKRLTPELERQYRLLGITVSATLEDVKKAYKEKLKYYHPDRQGDNPILQKVATDKTMQVVEAYKSITEFLTR
ncbi:MAG: J domain-containing protein [Treponema sp.]